MFMVQRVSEHNVLLYENYNLRLCRLECLVNICFCFDSVAEEKCWPIDPMHKWLQIKNSFVSIKISPTNLVFELIIQKNFCSQTRLVGLIYMHTKEFLIGSHLCTGSMVY